MGTAKPRTEWMGAVPRFSVDGPPRDWAQAHDTALQRTVLNPTLRSGHSIRVNLPVPRRASCHYYRVDADCRNVYFY